MKPKLHFFFPELAEKYGPSEAIILNHMLYWITHNSMNHKNYHDGRFWTFNSIRELAKQFPYFSKSQVGRFIKSLVKKGVLITGNYNRHRYDRTKWYALKDQKYFLENFHPFDRFKECKIMFDDNNTR